jgi:hypothetical protein
MEPIKGENMSDIAVILKALQSIDNKDSNAYKVSEYYRDLTTGNLDEGGKALARGKLLNIEKYLTVWTKDHPNEGTIMQPEETALILINDLRKRGLLK